MLGALAGLPSLGGIGGSFGGGALPLLGFSLLSTLTSQLTTNSFLGSRTGIPDLNSTNVGLGNLTSSFGSYTGSTSLNYAYGNDPSLQQGASAYQNWHQWATGGVQPPLCLAPYQGQALAPSGVMYGASGAYGYAGYGAAGSYGYGGASGAYGLSSAYACPPMFADAFGGQAHFASAGAYGAPAQYVTNPQPAYMPANYTQSYYGQPTAYDQQRNQQFNAWATEAFARFNSNNAQIMQTYGASQPGGAQAVYGSQAASLDITMSLPAYQQMPAYQGYQGVYQGLSAYGASSYGAYNLGWGYPSQPTPYFMPALGSYTGAVMQTQTAYGYGGPPRPAPCPPPPYPTRPPAPPEPTPPPVAVTPQVITPPPAPRTRTEYPRVPIISNDAGAAAQALGSRLVGDPSKIASFTQTNPIPSQNQDALRFDRIGAYFVMQQDSSLRYNVDTGRFFRTYSTGETKDVLDMSQVSQMLRQEHPDHFGRVNQLLHHLPSDEQLFGAKNPPASVGNSSTFTNGVSPINPGLPPLILPPVQQPVLPPLQKPTLPTFGGIPDSGGKVPALDQLVAQRDAGQISGNDFNLELIKIAAQTGAINPNPVVPGRPSGQFTITAHRYWDSAAGAYSDVSEVLLQGGENPNDTQRVFNPNKQTTVVINKDGVPLGNPLRVTVTWENGQSRTWDYQVNDPQGSDVDVFSPLG